MRKVYFILLASLLLASCASTSSSVIKPFAYNQYKYFTISYNASESSRSVVLEIDSEIVRLLESKGLTFVAYKDTRKYPESAILNAKYTIQKSMFRSVVTFQLIDFGTDLILFSARGQSTIGIPSQDIPRAKRVLMDNLRNIL